jgi:hypothetical protein
MQMMRSDLRNKATDALRRTVRPCSWPTGTGTAGHSAGRRRCWAAPSMRRRRCSHPMPSAPPHRSQASLAAMSMALSMKA